MIKAALMAGLAFGTLAAILNIVPTFLGGLCCCLMWLPYVIPIGTTLVAGVAAAYLYKADNDVVANAIAGLLAGLAVAIFNGIFSFAYGSHAYIV